MKRISFLDSHTGGEPTRLIEDASFLDLGSGSVAEKLSQTENKSRHLPLTGSQRTARLGRAGRRIACPAI